MRALIVFIILTFGSYAHANEKAVFEAERGFHWLEFHQPRRALAAFHKAIELGLPPQRDVFVRATYCETALMLAPTKPLIAFCRDAYEAYRDQEEPNRVAAVNGILATMAVELSAKAFFPDAEWAISELRGRREKPWDPTMPFQEQRARIGSAFLHVLHNRGKEALEELDQLRGDGRLLSQQDSIAPQPNGCTCCPEFFVFTPSTYLRMSNRPASPSVRPTTSGCH